MKLNNRQLIKKMLRESESQLDFMEGVGWRVIDQTSLNGWEEVGGKK